MEKKRKISRKKASFLKIFQDDFINKLPIPPAFTNIFGREIPPWFILEIPGTRKCWRVDIEEDGDGSLYLGYGFDCFVKAHSLETGNFLLFEHENPSILEVKIYEKDGSERIAEITFQSEYEVGSASESPKVAPIIQQESLTSHTMNRYEVGPASESPTETPIIHQETIESPSLTSHTMAQTPIVHQERNASSCLTSFTVTPVQFRESKKQYGANSELEYEVGANSESPTETPIIHQERYASPCLTSHTMTPIQFRENKKQRGAIGNGGNKRKKCFVSATERNVCFSLIWRKSHHLFYYLTIPRVMLSGKNFSNKDKLTVTDGEGNSWQMELRIRPDGRADFARGWREFVNDNDLGYGDKLTFKFTSNNVIQVHVQRASQVNDPSQTEQEDINKPSEHKSLTCEDKELADACTPSDKVPLSMSEFERVDSILKSSFSYTWTQQTRSYYLHVPKAIVNKQKLKNNDIVILCDPKGKQWLVEVKTRPSDGSVGLSRGWNDFTRAYGLGVGDILNFEFVTDRMMKVDVVKACELDHPNSGAIVKQEALKLD